MKSSVYARRLIGGFNFTIPSNRNQNCNVCNKQFKLSFITHMPYSEPKSKKKKQATVLIKDVVKACCEGCKNFNIRSNTSGQIKEDILQEALRKYDIVYPIFAYSKSVEVYGGFFIPFYEPSGNNYICFVKCLRYTKTLNPFRIRSYLFI